MKRAVIVHCWGGGPDYAWYPWVAKQLEDKGFTVTVPEMPDTEEPQLKKWLARLKEVIGTPDDELVLIGHSLGCATVLRYLEQLPKEQQVGKVMLVAAFTDPIGFKELENFFVKPLNFAKIKPKSRDGFVVLQSDNDPFVSEQYGIRLEEELGAELLIKEGAEHMSGPLLEEDSCTELPEVVEEVAGTEAEVTKLEKKLGPRKVRVPKALRTVLVSMLVLLILFGGAGFAYTYYVDKQNNANGASSNSAVDQQAARAITPTKPSPNSPENASIQVLDTPIARGQTDLVSVKTQATSTCTIAVTYFGGVMAHDPGLITKTADDFGTVNWNWNVLPTTPLGKGQVKVVCNFYSKSAMVEGDLEVTK